jgi:hypothetical protein
MNRLNLTDLNSSLPFSCFKTRFLSCILLLTFKDTVLLPSLFCTTSMKFHVYQATNNNSIPISCFEYYIRFKMYYRSYVRELLFPIFFIGIQYIQKINTQIQYNHAWNVLDIGYIFASLLFTSRVSSLCFI